MKFEEFCVKARIKIDQIPYRLIALDPGETTGYTLFVNGIKKDTKQLDTHNMAQATKLLMNLLVKEQPDFLVYENYKVYDWKTESHSWSQLHTSQFIGTIRTLCTLHDIPYHTQMAQQAKGFCDDTKLKEWGYYDKGMKHARDAVRHACFYILFNLGKRSDQDT